MTLSKFRIADTLSALQVLCTKLHAHLPYIYLLYALPAITLATWITPPFHVADEPHHFCRAEQISRGEIVALFYTDGSKEPRTIPDEKVLMRDIGGFTVNARLLDFSTIYMSIGPGEKPKVRRTHFENSKNIHWDREIGVLRFANTAIYPPTGYLVSAIVIIAGKLTNASILNTFYLARFVNGLVCALICFYALRLTKASRLLLFTVLLFPMTTSLFASVSQDGILISLAFLFFAIIGHVESSEEKHYNTKQLIMMVTAIVAISAARPPYFMFSFIFFFLHMNNTTRLTCFLASLAPVVLWGWLNEHNYAVVWAPPVLKINAPLQIKHILDDPLGFAGLFFKFDSTHLTRTTHEFIGVLGWKQLYLPDAFYRGALFSLLFAAAISTYYNVRERLRLRLRLALIGAAIAGGIAIMTVQYITWTALEATYLGGEQGRYFIPLFPAVALALAGFQKNIAIKKWHTPLFLGVIIFPFISNVVLVCQLIEGYYLTA
ncbi:DUF2142 domain-containing protein [Paraflavitalea soli]|uniref:DUF2142 domain-containing protein n=1 Tax=Paraflavitalea soli TaxID=2315862 RepID=A0A3B7MVI1_9BACT|nr:DUF2142 domain-containing protein [Paraflavitalea soli]AXY77239.1 DUF2142 domain-containing protein [Paraflavitalea soli]